MQYSSLLVPFGSLEENQVLWIQPLNPSPKRQRADELEQPQKADMGRMDNLEQVSLL